MSDLVGNPEDRFSQNEAHMTFLNIFNKPHFYTVKLGCTGVYIIFLILLQNKDFEYWLVVRTASRRPF